MRRLAWPAPFLGVATWSSEPVEGFVASIGKGS